MVNNLLDPAFLYRNNAREQNLGNYLRINLEGNTGNLAGIGAKVTVQVGDQKQFQEMACTRGYLSTVERALHFGLGTANEVDRIFVEWPDGKTQELTAIAANQSVAVKQSDATKTDSRGDKSEPLFTDRTKQSKLDFVHAENDYDDCATEVLLPHKMSQFGPALATGDVNGDGLDDVFFGGAAYEKSALYLQQANHTFKAAASQPWQKEHNREDVGATFIDIDGDNDLDLYVVRGGNEFQAASPVYKDRIFVNDGSGTFSTRPARSNDPTTSGSCAVPGDFDGDGDLDLFVGGRLVPRTYPFTPKSHILRNDKGSFNDATEVVAPDLSDIGMVTAAVWEDYDSDGDPDLIVTGEWMSIHVFRNTGGDLVDVTSETGLLPYSGWWNSLTAADIDGDGDMDFVAGNLGQNYKYKASAEEPFHVYCHDFDQSGSLDIVLGYFNNGECFPVRGRQCSSEQIPGIKKQFPNYESFGKATLKEVYGNALDQALHKQATWFSTSWIENKGDGTFAVHALPLHSQFSTVNGIIVHDFNHDQHPDILLAGNFYMSEIETGRADAGSGLLMLGDGAGNFSPVAPHECGFVADRDVRNIAMINTKEGQQPLIIVANNDDAAQVFRATTAEPPQQLAEE